MKGLGAFAVGIVLMPDVHAIEAPSPEFIRAVQVYQMDVSALSQVRIKSKASLFKSFFGSSDSSGIQRFITTRVKNIGYSSQVPEGVLAAAGEGVMFLTPAYHASDSPQVSRLAVVVHEARHLDQSPWAHVWCPSPYYFTLGSRAYRVPELEHVPIQACDDTEYGAYGVQYTFLRAIGESCSNCTDKVKMDARLFSDVDGMVRITDPKAAARLLEGASSIPVEAVHELEVLFQK